MSKKANMGEKSIIMPGPPKGERRMILRMGASTGSVKRNIYRTHCPRTWGNHDNKILTSKTM